MSYTISSKFFTGIGLQVLGFPSGNIVFPSASTRYTRRPFGGLQSCVVHNNLYCIEGTPSPCMKNPNCFAFVCPINRWAPLRIYGSINALKSDTSSTIWRMTGTFFKSMYDFINNGIVGKFSSHSFMLHHPKDASISSYVWPTKRKDINTSLKMPFATNNDEYAKTYLFLLSLAQLSNWTRIAGNNFMASTSSLGGSHNKCRHTSFPSNTTSYRNVDPVFSNKESWRIRRRFLQIT